MLHLDRGKIIRNSHVDNESTCAITHRKQRPSEKHGALLSLKCMVKIMPAKDFYIKSTATNMVAMTHCLVESHTKWKERRRRRRKKTYQKVKFNMCVFFVRENRIESFVRERDEWATCFGLSFKHCFSSSYFADAMRFVFIFICLFSIFFSYL